MQNKIEPQKTYEDFKAMEAKDEEQILTELKGGFLEEFVYSFPQGGKQVTGLSWAGVKEVARQVGGIVIEEMKIMESEDRKSYRVLARAKDLKTKNVIFGVAEQSKIFLGRPDSFALPKAVSKAQRNAIRALIPEVFIKKMMSEKLRSKPVRVVPPVVKTAPSAGVK